MLTDSLKTVLRKTLPGPYRDFQRKLTDYRLNRVTRSLERTHGLVVQSGPFAGMTYVSEAVCSSLVPKLLGSYEAELHEPLEQAVSENYRAVIDIGCAEGYYAVGLALRLPNARVHAFDIDVRARELCQRLAAANHVESRVVVESECTHKTLEDLISSGRCLIVCDCEGCELQLLDPQLVPSLKQSDLIVELHDMVDQRITPAMLSRFSQTHEITLIGAVERDPQAYPQLRKFSRLTRRAAVAEFRDGEMEWAYMRASGLVANPNALIAPE